MKRGTDYETWSTEQLRTLKHNAHDEAFLSYLRKERHAADKAGFLRAWLAPDDRDLIVEFGSSGGKTCVDLSLAFGCRTLGIDFDPEAVRIAEQMRDAHFPQLKDICEFREGDVTTMDFPVETTKILMPDFTEHIPNHVFHELLDNIRDKLPQVCVYIYTPDRNHLFEILKHRGILLKNSPGHINVKRPDEIVRILEEHGFQLIEQRWRPSHLPVWKVVESVMGRAPAIGKHFRRRIAIAARVS